MENTQTPIFEVPRELFHALLETLVLIRIKDKPVTGHTDSMNCIKIGHGTKVVEKKTQ